MLEFSRYPLLKICLQSMQSNKVFLETTIQIERIFGRNRNKILNFLKDKELITSSYVLMEFKRTILKDCITLYTYLKEEGSLSKTFERLSRLRNYEHRIASRMLRILAILSENGKIEYEMLIERLEDLIEEELLEYFFRDIKELLDETGCRLAKEEVKKQSNGYVLDTSCRKTVKNCRAKEFVINNKEQFVKLLKELNEVDEFGSVCRVIKDVLDEPDKIFGINCNKKLGDCIISIETPDDSIIFTNDHHYEPVCNALNKKFQLLKEVSTKN